MCFAKCRIEEGFRTEKLIYADHENILPPQQLEPKRFPALLFFFCFARNPERKVFKPVRCFPIGGRMKWVEALGILLIIIGAVMIALPGISTVWWGILIAVIGVAMSAYDWVKSQK